MIREVLCAIVPYGTLAALFVPPSVFLSQWSSSDKRTRPGSRTRFNSSSGRWAFLSCLSHVLLLVMLWLGAAHRQSQDLMLLTIVLMPLPVVANFCAWLLARPVLPGFPKTRLVMSMAAGLSLLPAALMAVSVDAPGLAALLGLFGAVNLLVLGAQNRIVSLWRNSASGGLDGAL